MTKAELIKALEPYPDDIVLYCCSAWGLTDPVASVDLVTDSILSPYLDISS